MSKSNVKTIRVSSNVRVG